MDLRYYEEMSYIVVIAIPPLPAEDAQAWDTLDALIAERGPTPPVFRDLHDRLTARYPCISSLPDDQVDAGVWSDGPLINNFGHRAAVLGLVPPGIPEALHFLIDSATALGCAVFDGQEGRIYRGPLHGQDRALLPGADLIGSLTQDEVAELIVDHLDPVLRPARFRLNRRAARFRRRIPGGRQDIDLSLVNYRPAYIVSLVILIQLDVVERIFQRFSDIEPRYYAEGWTTNTGLTYFVRDVPDRYRAPQPGGYRVETPEDIAGAMAHLLPIVQQSIVPFLDGHQTVRALHAGVNDPAPSIDITQPPADAMHAMILARLADDGDFERVVARCRESHGGPLSPRDQAHVDGLIAYLRQHSVDVLSRLA